MKKYLWAMAMMGTMAALSLAGCSKDTQGTKESAATTALESETEKAESPAKNSGQPIRVVNGKIEIDEPLKAFAKKYQEKTGQEVIIESLGGGVDINGTLKGYLAAGNMPDLFVFGGEGDYQTWKEYMADLSGEEWTTKTEFGFQSKDGKTVGFPYAVEGYGITYNKNILDAAGVDPSSLTSYDGFLKAFEAIDKKKEELGLTAVCSVAAESGQMYWSTGNHLFGYYLSGGLKRGDTTYIDLLKSGQTDPTRLGQFADFMKLLFDYSDKNTLISGTYDDQLALWAQGKTAFITQGNWIDPSLPDYQVEFDCGIAPLAFTKEEMKGVLADCPSWWALYNKGTNMDACKAFLTELALTKDGQECLVTDCGMISPYTTCTVSPKTPLAMSLKTYVDAGNTYSWEWTKMPEGISMNATGAVFELYAKGEIDREGFLSMLQTAISDYVK